MAAKRRWAFFIIISSLNLFFVTLIQYQIALTQSFSERMPKEIAQITLPKLLDFGMGKCIPCKKMLPILQELSEEYNGRVVIKIIEVHQEPRLTRTNRIQLIPTQIFFDAKNQEVYRHVGFMDKEEIKKIFENMGVK
ncbi:MAG: thioredoxin domain-containing protein [Thermodesulfobacteriota bacterium]|jgi:thioredoxin 1